MGRFIRTLDGARESVEAKLGAGADHPCLDRPSTPSSLPAADTGAGANVHMEAPSGCGAAAALPPGVIDAVEGIEGFPPAGLGGELLRSLQLHPVAVPVLSEFIPEGVAIAAGLLADRLQGRQGRVEIAGLELRHGLSAQGVLPEAQAAAIALNAGAGMDQSALQGQGLVPVLRPPELLSPQALAAGLFLG